MCLGGECRQMLNEPPPALSHILLKAVMSQRSEEGGARLSEDTNELHTTRASRGRRADDNDQHGNQSAFGLHVFIHTHTTCINPGSADKTHTHTQKIGSESFVGSGGCHGPPAVLHTAIQRCCEMGHRMTGSTIMLVCLHVCV